MGLGLESEVWAEDGGPAIISLEIVMRSQEAWGAWPPAREPAEGAGGKQQGKEVGKPQAVRGRLCACAKQTPHMCTRCTNTHGPMLTHV